VARRARPAPGRQLRGRRAADRVARGARLHPPALFLRSPTRDRPAAPARGLAGQDRRGALPAQRGRRCRPCADLRRRRVGRGTRTHAAVAGGVAVDADARLPRLGRAPRRAPGRLGRRPRVQRRARADPADRGRPRRPRYRASAGRCCCTRLPSFAPGVRPRSPSECRPRTRTPSGCTGTSASRSHANGGSTRGRRAEGAKGHSSPASDLVVQPHGLLELLRAIS
jgi:hypothetical protein